MSRFNTRDQQPQKRSPITAARKRGLTTHEGAPGFERDTLSELFVLAAGSFYGTDSFYESGNDRADRFRTLVQAATITDAPWVARFLKWLRGDGNIRTAAIVGAVEYARALQALARGNSDTLPLHESQTARAVVRSVLQRADEPGEMLAYFTSMYGRSVPIAVKRGIADAIVGHDTDRGPLYTEYSMLKYDTASHAYRFADVIELVHPTGEHPEVKGTTLGALFEYALDRRHSRGTDPGAYELGMLRRNIVLRDVVSKNPGFLLDAEGLKEAGMTWEDALSLGGSKLDKAKLWQSLLDADAIGYMAMLRNLRNFEEAGISKDHAGRVSNVIGDPERVAKSRQLPFRFWSAYKNTGSLRYAQALEDALDASVSNVPELDGRTLILVDMSGSMGNHLSPKSSVTAMEAAALFGTVLAHRGASVSLVGFAQGSFAHQIKRGGSVLRDMAALTVRNGEVGYATNATQALREHYAGHTRVVILSDMQIMGGNDYWGGELHGISEAIPQHVPLYAWNLMGYQPSMMSTGKDNRHELGGFGDGAFKIMQTLEAGRDGKWPF